MDYRTVRALKRRATPRQLKAAKLLSEGKPIRHAMVEAGYSQATADQGIQAVPKVVLALMPQETNLVDLGAALTAVQQEQLVRGRLMWNTLRGVDKGVASAYRLGQDKRVSMFIPENMTGVVVINSPTAVASSPTVPEDNE